jgi:hypothetical protein
MRDFFSFLLVAEGGKKVSASIIAGGNSACRFLQRRPDNRRLS